jgi:hypothetical protein
MPKCFIDSNIIANYILIKRLIGKARNKKDYISQIVNKNPGAFFAYGLIESIR